MNHATMPTPSTPPARRIAHRLRPWLLATAAWALVQPVQAGTPGVDEPPPAGTPRPPQLPRFEDSRLANGLRVVVAPRHDLPLVTVALHLRPGALAESATGVASLTATLRTKGARRAGRVYGATALAQQAEALGGSLSAGADWHGTSLSMTVARSQLPAALALIRDVSLSPTLTEDELRRLKDETADGLKMALSDPGQLASQLMRRLDWGDDSPYGRSLTPAGLARLRLADLRAFHQRQLRPDGATLVISGDITLDDAQALAQSALGRWQAPASPTPAPAAAAKPSPEQPAAARAPSAVLLNLPGTGQSAVWVSAPGVALHSPERRVAQVAAAVLGGGYSARINTEVRIKRGLSYGASAGLESLEVGGRLHASAQTDHGNAAQVLALLRSEITRLGQEAPSAEELAARQATLVGGFGRQTGTTAGLTGVALDLIARQRPLGEAAQLVPELLAVSAEQVRDFAARHWQQAAGLRAVVVGDLAAAGPSLQTATPDAQVLEAATLDLDGLRLGR